MKATEIRELSERWGVKLQGFENMVISLKSDNYYDGGMKEVSRITRALERKGYRLCGARYGYGDIAVYVHDNGTYGFNNTVMSNLPNFKYVNIDDLQGEQIIDKNMFFGFVYGFAFAVLLMLLLCWIF